MSVPQETSTPTGNRAGFGIIWLTVAASTVSVALAFADLDRYVSVLVWAMLLIGMIGSVVHWMKTEHFLIGFFLFVSKLALLSYHATFVLKWKFHGRSTLLSKTLFFLCFFFPLIVALEIAICNRYSKQTSFSDSTKS